MLTGSIHQLENKSFKTDCTLQKTHKAPTTKQIINAPQAAALRGRCDKVVNYSVGNRITDVNRRVQEVNPLSLLVHDKRVVVPTEIKENQLSLRVSAVACSAKDTFAFTEVNQSLPLP